MECYGNEVESANIDHDGQENGEGTINSEIIVNKVEAEPVKTLDFEITKNFLENSFKYNQETDSKVWHVAKNVLPVRVQVIKVSAEKNESQAFSVCDGEGYMSNTCFISRDRDVSLNSIIKITSLEDVRNEDYDKTDFLLKDSIFDDVLAIAEFETLFDGQDVGHCLWALDSSKVFYVLASGSLDVKDGHADFLNNKDLWMLTTESSKCDVKFEFPEGSALNAHKHVLKERSSVFEAHFSGKVFSDQELVKISDSSLDTFKKFLMWIYGYNIQFESLEAIFELVYLSDKYMIEDFLTILRAKIKEHLNLTPKNTIRATNLNRTNDVKIQKIALDVVDANLQLLFSSGEFKKWDLETMCFITARDSLAVDEWQLLLHVVSWAEENAEHENQVMKLINNINFEEISKIDLKDFLRSDRLKNMKVSSLIQWEKLEALISLQLFKKSSSLDKRLLYSREPVRFSSYRSTAQFQYDEHENMFPPVTFPVEVPIDQLTSLPMVLLNDNFTLVQPNINLNTSQSNEFYLECLIRLNGAVTGLPDLSVFRQADYFRHVSDIQAMVELHYQNCSGWHRQVKELSQGGVMVFKGIKCVLSKDLLSDRQVFRGCLVVRQFKSQENRMDVITSFTENMLSESEPEGEDVGHDGDEEEDDEENETGNEDLNGFIVSDTEEVEEEREQEVSSESSENSSEEEIRRNVRIKKRKHERRGPEKKKRKLRIESDSENDEMDNNQDENNYGNEEESEYETDNDLGDDVQGQSDENEHEINLEGQRFKKRLNQTEPDDDYDEEECRDTDEEQEERDMHAFPDDGSDQDTYGYSVEEHQGDDDPQFSDEDY